MCGIAGIIPTSQDSKIVAADIVKRMTDHMRLRGPDAEGTWVGEGVVLGHRRLSIIDLDGGQQPITNEDGSITIVFNGEIYNYQEIKANLEKHHQFRTKSDTEVILHLYQEKGEECVKYLRASNYF